MKLNRYVVSCQRGIREARYGQMLIPDGARERRP